MQKLVRIVEHHPQFHYRLEEILERIYTVLKPDVSAASAAASTAARKEKNEESCPIFKLSNDLVWDMLVICNIGLLRILFKIDFIGSTLKSLAVRKRPKYIALQHQCPVRNYALRSQIDVLVVTRRNYSRLPQVTGRWKCSDGSMILAMS